MRSVASWLGFFTLVCAVAGCECGDDTPGDVDAGDDAGSADDGGPRPDAGPITRCGDGMMEGAEECDDANEDPDDGCSPTCELECGDGVLNGDELCDTAIAAGEAGACPTDCDDGDACTTDALDGSGCSAECSNGPIGAPIDDDGCCPLGEDSTTDNDCTGTCGDRVVDAGETCDTGFVAGETGECPSTCDDGASCTDDILNGAGTCIAQCDNVPITEPADSDGCCPAGATTANDNDCLADCGDGIVTSPAETCDTAITAGTTGSCPTTCNDGDMCTTDTLMNGGSCTARCASAPVAPGPGDGCCPRPAANVGNDSDCPAMCGDRIVTPPETCDDGSTASGDGCSATCTLESTGFRFTDLDLRDPHVFADAPFIGCTDVTNFSAFGIDGVNPQIQNAITMDGDTDGDLDLSLVQAFSPLLQTAGMSTPSYIAFPTCTAPMSSTMCTLAAGATRTPGTAMNMGAGAVCLDVVAGTTRATYMPPIVIPTAPAGGTCYVASAGTITFDLGGILITLQDASIAGEWFGAPATEIRDGMIRGFISEADANTTYVPEGLTGIDTIDGEPLSTLLRGGAGNCNQPAPMMGDKDTYTPPGGGAPITGWYFYLNFRAARVPYTAL